MTRPSLDIVRLHRVGALFDNPSGQSLDAPAMPARTPWLSAVVFMLLFGGVVAAAILGRW